MPSRDVRTDVKEGRPVPVPFLAEASGWPRSTLYAQIAKGELEVMRIGRAIRVKPEAARRLLGMEQEVRAA